MKRLGLSLLCTLTCGVLCALPVGNPADPRLYTNSVWSSDCEWGDPCDPCTNWLDWFDLRLGYYGDFVYNRHLEIKDLAVVEDVQITTNAGLIVLNICHWLDLFANVGVSNFGFSTDSLAGANSYEVAFSPTLSYGGGGRLTFWSYDDFYLGLEGQYFYSNSKLLFFEVLDDGVLTYFSGSSNRDAGYGEWQVALACAYRVLNRANFSLIPYGGVQFSGVDWQLKGAGSPGNSFEDDLQEQRLTGWALGMTALLCDVIGVSVEGRWANEKAFSVIGQLNF